MEPFSHAISERLRAQAMSLPETSEGTSCVNRAFKVRKKNFLFVGEKDGGVRVMLKLVDSIEQARALADPRVDVGAGGWVTLRFVPDDVPVPSLLSSWVLESFRVLAPKTLVKQLDAAGLAE